MTFKMKEYAEIFLEALQDALLQGLISHQEEFEQYIKNRQDISNFYVMILSVHSEVFDEVYRKMQLIYDSVNLNKATGEDLDKRGEWVGIPRAKATRAYVDVTLNLTRAQDEDVTIPKGLQCITRNGIGYHTIEDAYFPTGTTTVTVPAYADNPGVSSRIIENSLYKITTSITGVEGSVKCYNDSASSGGSEVQSDDEYRKYLLNWTEVKQRGNKWAYRNYFANFEGLDGYQLIPRWDGSGTIKIVTDPASDTLRQQIYDEVQADVALFDDDVVVMPFTGRSIDIYTKVDVNIDQINPYSETEKEDIQLKIQSAIRTFIDGGYRENGEYYRGLEIGEDFIPHKLAVFLDKEISELKNITFLEPESYIELNDEEKGVTGELTIEMI